MKKTVKYVSKNPSIPSNFVALSTHKGTRYWKKEETADNYFLGELSRPILDMNSSFYHKFFTILTKNRKNKKRNTQTYEWREFLLFIFGLYQKASKRKLIPRARARAIRAFIEDFQSNVSKLDGLDEKYHLTSRADKIFYLKKDSKTYLLGFLINKKLFITFPYIISHLVEKYVHEFSSSSPSTPGRDTYIGNFIEYFLFLLYKEWGVKIIETKTKRKITIGADPEFLIYPKYKGNPKIADYREMQRASNIILSSHSNDELGLDGCTDLGELRPPPSTSPHTLTRNIKKILNKFYSEYGDKYFIETGGGCENSIGGHIHLGHELFQNYTNAQIKPLLQLLDAFLYHPIKLNMYGAVREWRDYNELNVDIDYYNGECKVDENPEKIVQTIKKVKPLKGQQFNAFDAKSQCRSQPHGLEYRSLPSFIGDFTFTKLVFRLAQNIAEKYIELRGQGIEFTYNDPPQKEDYLVFLKEKEVKQLFEYLYGKKKDLFLKNTLDNWKVIKQFYINFVDNLNIFGFLNPEENARDDRSKFETIFSRNYQSTLRDINHSLKIYFLASNHYYKAERFRKLAHPIFITTRQVNFSTFTEDELTNYGARPNDNYIIYIGMPYLWRDRGYILDKKKISKIIGNAVQIFHTYYKKRNNFKFDQSLSDLKKIPLYNNCFLSQMASEINEYGKLFKKKKEPPEKRHKTVMTRRTSWRLNPRPPTPDEAIPEEVFVRTLSRAYSTDMNEDSDGEG